MNTPLKIGQPRFLTTDEVLSLHRLSIDTYGGADGVLDAGKLDASLAMPKQGVSGEYAHEFPFGMAAAYGYHIAMNHAFRDGNKRTAFAAMVAFLRMAGWDFEMPDGQAAKLMLELIESRRDKQWLASRIAEVSRSRPSIELRDFFALADPIKFHQFILSIQATPADAELDQTAREAAAVMPSLSVLLNAAAHYNEHGEHERAQAQIQTAMAFIAIFRVAEELGYEW